mmetsp:Transcript_36678/g.57594  ORF Transcript_36678/g.57594 Transcript_36678/m.57594 type:complete len:384 (-) Transcript_36678:1034-2185(-)
MPIYSRYGDESKLSGLMGLFAVIMTYHENDELLEINAGRMKVVFLQKGPWFFVSLSHTSEPTLLLHQQLEFLYNQILFLLTAGVQNVYKNKPSYDLRNLLSGTEKMFDNLISYLDHQPSAFSCSLPSLPIDRSCRSSICKFMVDQRPTDVIFALVVAKDKFIVSFLRPKKLEISVMDIHLILNFLGSGGGTLRRNETWSPVCLPGINENGFFHSLIKYLNDDVCVMLISTKQDAFYELSAFGKTIATHFEKEGWLKTVTDAANNPEYEVSKKYHPNVLHFMYIHKKTNQFTQPTAPSPFYAHRKEKKRLFRMYQHLYSRSKEMRLSCCKSKFEIMFFWQTDQFCLFAVFDPLETKKGIVKGCNEVSEWVKDREGRFFKNFPVY